jgi:DNA mismatch endonuclease, patch repair protein
MVDVVDIATRSRMMSGIRGRNTKPEIMVRSMLHREGFRFRLHAASLPGKPDILLPRYRSVIFVNGCFWHGHCCSLFKWPSTRPDFWQQKIARNRQNDSRAHDALLAAGWRVAVVWECALKGKARLDSAAVITGLTGWLRLGNESFYEIRGEMGALRPKSET